MKRIVACVLAAAALFLLCSCGRDKGIVSGTEIYDSRYSDSAALSAEKLSAYANFIRNNPYSYTIKDVTAQYILKQEELEPYITAFSLLDEETLKKYGDNQFIQYGRLITRLSELEVYRDFILASSRISKMISEAMSYQKNAEEAFKNEKFQNAYSEQLKATQKLESAAFMLEPFDQTKINIIKLQNMVKLLEDTSKSIQSAISSDQMELAAEGLEAFDLYSSALYKFVWERMNYIQEIELIQNQLTELYSKMK